MSHNIHTKSALQSRIQNIWTRSITYHIKITFKCDILQKNKNKTTPPPEKRKQKEKNYIRF